jgi:invasion protein IalB
MKHPDKHRVCDMIRSYIFTTFIWVLSLSSAHAQNTPTKEIVETGWVASCMSNRVCELKYEISQNAQVAAAVSVFNIRQDFWLQYTIPLGIDLTQGIYIAIDENPNMATLVSSCSVYGCIGKLDLTPSIIAGMKQGESLYIRFINSSTQEQFSITMNLSGFTSGFDDIVP